MRRRQLAFLEQAALALRKRGKTYFIDFKNGNDSTGKGSSTQPYKTLSKFLAVCANGDTCKVRGSLADSTTWYRETNLSTTKQRLRILPDTGHTPAFVHSANYASWAKTGGLTNVYETAYTPAAMYGAWNGTQYLTKVADAATCDTTANSCYADLAGDKLYVNIGGDAPTSIEAKSASAKYLDLGGAGNLMAGIRMQYLGNTGLILSGNGNGLSGMSFCYGSRAATNYYLTQVTGVRNWILNCTFSDIGYMEFVEVQGGGTVTVSNCDGVGAGAGVHVYLAGDAQVNDCTFERIRGNGVYTYGATATVTDSVFVNCSHAGVLSGNANAAITCTRCLNYTDTDPWTIWSDLDAQQHSYGYVAENNGVMVCYHCVTANGDINSLVISENSGGGFWAVGLLASMTTRNCISYENGKDGFFKNSTSTIDHDYCCCYGSANAFDGGPAEHDTTDDPLFTDGSVGGNDFTLQAGSPCVNTGLAIPGVNDDYVGAAPDMGVFEKE